MYRRCIVWGGTWIIAILWVILSSFSLYTATGQAQIDSFSQHLQELWLEIVLHRIYEILAHMKVLIFFVEEKLFDKFDSGSSWSFRIGEYIWNTWTFRMTIYTVLYSTNSVTIPLDVDKSTSMQSAVYLTGTSKVKVWIEVFRITRHN